MIKLTKSLSTWGSDLFAETLKQEIRQLPMDQLPLQQGLTSGNHASNKNMTVMILSTLEDKDSIHVKTGIFYTGIISGCNCADDPSPADEHPEYCEVLFEINKVTAQTALSLLSD